MLVIRIIFILSWILLAKISLAQKESVFTAEIEDRSRTYYLFFTQDFASNLPVVICLHDYGWERRTLPDLIKTNQDFKANAIIAFPNGIDRQWHCDTTNSLNNSDLELLKIILVRARRDLKADLSSVPIIASGESFCVAQQFALKYPEYNISPIYWDPYKKKELIRSQQLDSIMTSHDEFRKTQVVAKPTSKERVWELEKHKQRSEELAIRDSITLHSRSYIPRAIFGAGAQFPFQQRIYFDYITSYRLGFYAGIGWLANSYVNVALDYLKNQPRNDNNPFRQNQLQFIQDRLQGGGIVELGLRYHSKSKWYGGVSFQFQRFILEGTIEDFVLNVVPEDLRRDIEERVTEITDRFNFLTGFYDEEVYKPSIAPTQLVINLGRRFHPFKKVPRLGIDLGLSYYINLGLRSNFSSSQGIIDSFISNLIDPRVESTLSSRFDSFNIPAVSLSVFYAFGLQSKKR